MSGKPGEERRNPMPGGARVAGALWCALGLLGLAGAGWSLATIEELQIARGWFGFALLSVFFAVFLSNGVRTLKGRLRSLTGNGIASILMAAAYATNVALLDERPFFEITPGLFWHLLWIGGLSIAGIVALAVRADYKRWRETGRMTDQGSQGELPEEAS